VLVARGALARVAVGQHAGGKRVERPADRGAVGRRPLGETKGDVRTPSAAFVCPCVFAFSPPEATSARRPRGVQYG
jgi:hypothetical protein